MKSKARATRCSANTQSLYSNSKREVEKKKSNLTLSYYYIDLENFVYNDQNQTHTPRRKMFEQTMMMKKKKKNTIA